MRLKNNGIVTDLFFFSWCFRKVQFKIVLGTYQVTLSNDRPCDTMYQERFGMLLIIQSTCDKKEAIRNYYFLFFAFSYCSWSS